MMRTIAAAVHGRCRGRGGVAGRALGVLAGLGLALAAAADTVSESVLYAFSGPDGSGPNAPLILGSDGNFYGTTPRGGAYGDGTVFRLSPQGALTVLHAFKGGADGTLPQGGVIQAGDGAFYGTTLGGGAGSYGTVFRIDGAGNYSVVASFAAGQGNYPYAGLVAGGDGNFYGVTYEGGSYNLGTVFRVTPAGVISTLHSFAGLPDGANPVAPLALGPGGMLYGSTLNQGAGSQAFGTLFRIGIGGGALTTLVSFQNTPGASGNGGSVRAGLVLGSDGNFYGTTSVLGGPNSAGTVFRLTPAGALTTLHAFDGHVEGGIPYGGLIQGGDGSLFGVNTSGGGSPDELGTVFRLTPQNALLSLHLFGGGADGVMPEASLVRGGDGALYGTTTLGGGANLGIVFRLTDALPVLGFGSAGETMAANSSGELEAKISVQLSAPSLQPVTVSFGKGGSEAAARYTVTPASPLVIPAGATSATLDVLISSPALVQCDSSIVLSLGTPDYATLGAITVNTVAAPHNFLGALFCPRKN